MIAVDQTHVEHETNHLINFIAPINRSNEIRRQIVTFIRDILHRSAILEGYVIECGSSSLKSYLPEGDLDLVLVAPSSRSSREEIQYLTTIFNSWCDEIADKEEGKSSYPDFTIRNVEFVNARTKLAHCLVNNISVDITINQIGAILTLTFLEEADRLIGVNHLFKRSLLLIKAWCLHESGRYCGTAITGAKVGMLSSYAVSVLVLHVFNRYSNLTHPFSVLRSFLYTYMSFPWDTSVLTIDGAVPLVSFAAAAPNGYNGNGTGGARGYGAPDVSDLVSVSTYNSNASSQSGRARGLPPLPPPPPPTSPPESSNRFQSILDALAQHPALLLYQQGGSAVHHGRFAAKCCNIVDPVDPYNNLGISVPRANLQLITQACRSGYHHLETYLRRFPHCPPGSQQYYGGGGEGQEYQYYGTQPLPAGAVKQMLNPVPPANLGYVGTVGNAHPHPNNHNINTTSMNNVTDMGMQEQGLPAEHAVSTNSLSAMGHPSAGNSVSSTPYRRNSRTSKPPSFLAEFFSSSLQLYSSAEGEPLRVDLLTHPLQPLSSSTLLANPHYHPGVQSSPRWEPGTPSHPVRKSLTLSNEVGAATEAGSVASHASSGVTDQVSNSQSDLSHRGGRGGGGGGAGAPAPASVSEQDPLAGDLQAMYEALDLFVSSRHPPRPQPQPIAGVTNSNSGSARKTQANSGESSVVSYKSTPSISASALCAAEIRALSAAAGVKPSTPAGSAPGSAVKNKDILMQLPGSAFKPSQVNTSREATEQARRAGATGTNGSPDGSTTSGTESVRQRADISISDDSVTEEGSSSDDENSDASDDESGSSESEHGDNTNAPADLLTLTATAIPYSPSKSAATVDSPATGVDSVLGPVGSVVAFFRAERWAVAYENLAAQWSLALPDLAAWRLSDQPTHDEEDAPSSPSSAPAAGVAPPSPVMGAQGRRKSLSKKGDHSKQQGTTQSTPGAGDRKDRKASAAAVIAAAARRGKRTLLQRLLVWLQQRSEASWTALSGAGVHRPLLIALVYSLLMILVINVALKLGPPLPRQYAQWLDPSSQGASVYAERFHQLHAWLLSASHKGKAGSSSSRDRPVPEQDEGPANAFDFSAARFSLFGAEGEGETSLSSILQSALPYQKASQTAAPGGPLAPPVHWVKEGDGISFGDFGISGGSATSSGATASTATTTAAQQTAGSAVDSNKAARSASAPTGSTGTRATASTAATASSSAAKTRAPPSETVQRTQYIPKPEYVLTANNAVLKSPYVYQWTKDGVNITNPFYQNQPFFSIRQTRAKDAGVYRCYRYEEGVSAPPVLLLETAIRISKPPTVGLKPSQHEVKAGTTMVLNLAAEGTPPPVFQWYKNGYPVPGLTAQVLLMENVNASHSGTYSCEVQNIAGRLMWLEATIVVVD